MTPIRQNIDQIVSTLPEGVKLIAVTKTRTVSEIYEACSAGLFRFGENKVQELLTKQSQIDSQIEWHLIGHLQMNKVKSVIPYAALIHSVDSFRLLREINLEATKYGKIVPCLIQFHIANEETKFGFSELECRSMLSDKSFAELTHVSVQGVMGMATFTHDTQKVASEFRHLREIFESLKREYFSDRNQFTEVSMGMSGDYRIAIDEGSTMVRIGSLIFGER